MKKMPILKTVTTTTVNVVGHVDVKLKEGAVDRVLGWVLPEAERTDTKRKVVEEMAYALFDLYHESLWIESKELDIHVSGTCLTCGHDKYHGFRSIFSDNPVLVGREVKDVLLKHKLNFDEFRKEFEGHDCQHPLWLLYWVARHAT